MSTSIFAITVNCQVCLERLYAAGFSVEEISTIGRRGPNSGSMAGRLQASGPITRFLADGGGLSGPLTELGLPAYAAMRYEEAIRRGGMVVAVHTDNRYEVETVTELLRDGGCEQVAAA